jgi:predicted nucleotide-binding protein (sugar kinase/HSP70/actin superfamily)
MISTIPVHPKVNSYMCPWGQTLPFVVGHAPLLEQYRDRLLKPSIEFAFGNEFVSKALNAMVRPFGISKSRSYNAFNLAFNRQMQFRKELLVHGKETLSQLETSGEKAIVLVGRPYNIYDNGINLDLPRKMRDYYGVNLIPFDFLDTDRIDIQDINDNMFWNYGRKIIAAARAISSNGNLDLIYLTNFKCGPDSYVKHYVSEALGRPFLVLQFDEHSNDAGYLTRCEAYLNSKGFIQ